MSTFVPPLVRAALGEHRFAIGLVMAIDNVLLLILVPWAGPASDRASARGRGRLPLVLAALVLSSLGMALLPFASLFGLAVLIALRWWWITRRLRAALKAAAPLEGTYRVVDSDRVAERARQIER